MKTGLGMLAGLCAEGHQLLVAGGLLLAQLALFLGLPRRLQPTGPLSLQLPLRFVRQLANSDWEQTINTELLRDTIGTHLRAAGQVQLSHLLLHLRAGPRLGLNLLLGLQRRARLLLRHALRLRQPRRGLLQKPLLLLLHGLQLGLQVQLPLLRQLGLLRPKQRLLPLHLLFNARSAAVSPTDVSNK